MKTNDATRASAEALPKINLYRDEADIVVQIGRQIGDAYRKEDELQVTEFRARQENDHRRAIYAESRCQHEWDRIDTLRAALACYRATSTEGAAIQIAEALTLVDLIWDQYPRDEESYEVKNQFRTLNRLLYSAFAAIDAVTPQKTATLIGHLEDSAWRSPFVEVDDALAFLDAKDGKQRGAS